MERLHYLGHSVKLQDYSNYLTLEEPVIPAIIPEIRKSLSSCVCYFLDKLFWLIFESITLYISSYK